MSGFQAPFSQFFIGMLKPSLPRDENLLRQPALQNAFFRIHLRTPPRTFSCAGIDSARSMTSLSR